MYISSVNVSPFSLITNKKSADSKILVQRSDVVSFTGKKAFSYTDKGILQTAIDECKNKEEIEALLKNEEGLYKYRPFTVFEILTQRNKPNFAQNLKALQEFKIGNSALYPCSISKLLAACDGQDVKVRLDLITASAEKGIKLPLVLFCTDNNKFKKIKNLLELIDSSNKDKIISACRRIAEPEIEKPLSCMGAEERLLHALLMSKKHKRDDLEKLIASKKYKNISLKALKKYKNNHFWNYVELYEKSKTMPQILDMIDYLIGLGKHPRHKESWIRKILRSNLKFEEVANIFLQKDSPVSGIETDIFNRLLFGKQSPELKKRIREFTKRTGVSLTTDNNIPVSYIDRFEKLLPSLNHHYTGNNSIAIARMTSIIDDNTVGFCHNAGINIFPSQLNFDETVFHEYAHVAHKRCIPFDVRKGISMSKVWDDLLDKKFYPKDSIEYKTTVSQLREYAAKDFAEFVAVLNEMVGTGKFDVVINEKGEKVLRKYLKPGDTTTAKDLEILMDIYKSVFGPDIGAKKITDKIAQYVETPFKGTKKFNIIEFMCANAKKVMHSL